MNGGKTGELIAKLRKQHDMTQQELGDKVGVGFRAVSNWERGNTLPDIGNMNELSKIFGITVDEILTGKLNENIEQVDKKKLSKKAKTIISIITAVIVITVIVTSILISNNNKTYIYQLSSTQQDEYVVEGQASFHKNQISVIVNKLYFEDKNLSSMTITNYEYQIISKNTMLFGFGFNPDGTFVGTKMLKEITDDLRINYIGNSELTRKEILKNNIIIKFTFWDDDNKTIEKVVELELLKSTKNN